MSALSSSLAQRLRIRALENFVTGNDIRGEGRKAWFPLHRCLDGGRGPLDNAQDNSSATC